MPRRHDDGVAVPLVLMVVAVIATFGALLAHLSTTRLRLAAISAESTENGLLADGIVHVVAARIFDAGGDLGAFKKPEYCTVGEKTVEVAVYATRGLIDLNASAPDRMFALFKGIGVEEGLARRLTDGVIDFRDVDDERISGGSEQAAYIAAGLPFTPKNAPFEAVEELDQVLGMGPEIFAAVAPYVTVFSRSPDWDPNLAPVRLRSALGVTDQSQPSGGSASGSLVRSIKVWVAVSSPGGARETRAADIEFVAGGRRRFGIKSWSRGVGPPMAALASGLSAPQCPEM